MELGNFQKSVDSDEIKTMAFEIIGEPVKAVSRICEQWGEAEDEVRCSVSKTCAALWDSMKGRPQRSSRERRWSMRGNSTRRNTDGNSRPKRLGFKC